MKKEQRKEIRRDEEWIDLQMTLIAEKTSVGVVVEEAVAVIG